MIQVTQGLDSGFWTLGLRNAPVNNDPDNHREIILDMFVCICSITDVGLSFILASYIFLQLFNCLCLQII
jgi:hypothetical protein